MFLIDDDLYIGSLLELLNVRFAAYPTQGDEDGIAELRVLQQEFKIFDRQRALETSLRLLNVGGTWNPQLKNRWFRYIANLEKVESNVEKLSGSAAIVDAIVTNLGAKDPLPVYFTSHDQRDKALGKRVLIAVASVPFYLDTPHIVCSMPMKPHQVVLKKPKRTPDDWPGRSRTKRK